METKDFSLYIFNKYYHSAGMILKVTLKDKTELEGIFVGFFHGDVESNEPYIIKWHFLDKDEMPKYPEPIVAAQSQEIGRMIDQQDIESVEFK